MLGRAVTETLERAFPGTVSATRWEVDVTDRFRLDAEVERLRPDLVVNCAAYTDVDGCEIDRDRARRVNAEGAENAARAAAAAGCPIVHVSTDFVFDGRKGAPYSEDDPPSPLSEYGRSKYDGERRVAAATPEHLIVRTSWLYGPGRGNFVDSIRARARNGGTLRVVDDQFGSPTYVADLARALHHLAQAVLSVSGMSHVRLEPIRTDEAGRIAIRPAYAALDTSRYASLIGEGPRPWEVALRDYLDADRSRAGGG
ncbi:MAG: hypothetical protein AUG03_01980 [Acidobacteria bacterium 13_1_20CM_2_68_14]|nr:MAG: hypothetical protein AUG03_01980 [Acidobacteria bacterium 13_1_20CM_2_68_14]